MTSASGCAADSFHWLLVGISVSGKNQYGVLLAFVMNSKAWCD
jgi:hypothetical protein